MAQSEIVRQLTPLTLRDDLPADVREVLKNAIQDARTPLHTDRWIYRVVVSVLGAAVLATIIGGIALVIIGRGEQNMQLPDGIVAIGSAAVGAIAGLLAPSPARQ
jgi:hypothetical protein